MQWVHEDFAFSVLSVTSSKEKHWEIIISTHRMWCPSLLLITKISKGRRLYFVTCHLGTWTDVVPCRRARWMNVTDMYFDLSMAAFYVYFQGNIYLML